MLTYRVEDMTCGHCASTITAAVRALDTDANVVVDLPEKEVRIESKTADEATFRRAIADAGFSPIPVVTNPTARPKAGVCACREKCGCS